MSSPKKDATPSVGLYSKASIIRAPDLDRRLAAPRAATSTFELVTTYKHSAIGNWCNVMHFKPEEEPFAQVYDVLNDLLLGFQGNVETELLACLAGDCTLVSYSGRRIEGGSPTAVIYVGTLGSSAGTVDTTAIAVNLNFVPIEAPWNYGHWYIGGISDAFVAGNHITGGFDVHGDDLLVKLLSAFDGGGTVTAHWSPVIYERSTGAGRLIGHGIRDAKPTVLARRLRPWVG